MKVIRTPGRGLGQRLVFEESEFDTIGLQALRSANLLSGTPGPVRIDRFVESQFGVTIDYQDLGEGILGATTFRKDGSIQGITVSDHLAAATASLLFRSTVAHESGHGLLHPILFMEDGFQADFRLDNANPKRRRILCRSRDINPGQRHGYDGRWWEYQANRMIGSLLLPRALVIAAAAPFLGHHAVTQSPFIKDVDRLAASKTLAAIFEVSSSCMDIRLDDIFPRLGGQQEF